MPLLSCVDTANPRLRQSWLTQHLATNTTLLWTDNRASMISVRGGAMMGYHLRLHHMFRHAPDVVWLALVAFIRDADANARRILRLFIQNQQHLIRPSSPRQSRGPFLQPQGRYFDLEAICCELNQTYFANRVQARITWTRLPPRRRRNSIRFGSYHEQQRLIRIHRLLDQSFVPRYFVESIVFHEMLHQLLPRQYINGRWYVHHPEFQQHELQFSHYCQAKRWQRRHLAHLLRG